MTREEWALEFIEQCRPWLASVGATVPPRGAIQVGWGFPTRGARSRAIGQALAASTVDGDRSVTDIIISIKLSTTHDIASTLVHELVHAAAGISEGHGGEFVRIAKAMGLEGIPTECGLGEHHAGWLAAVVAIIGECPHRAARVRVPTQGTRMLKVRCEPECECGGYSVRTTAKWLELGLPLCPYGNEMKPVD